MFFRDVDRDKRNLQGGDNMIRDDVMEMRSAFWAFYEGKISLAEMQAAIKEIMNRQGKLPI